VLRVREVAGGRDRDDVLSQCKHTSVAWLADGSGFHYTRNRRARRRSGVGEAQPACVPAPARHEADGGPRGVRAPGGAQLTIWIAASEDQRLLVITARRRHRREERAMAGTACERAPAQRPVPIGRAMLVPAGNRATRWFATTDLDAPNRRVVTFDESAPAPESWETLIVESNGVIDSCALLDGRIAIVRQYHVSHRLAFHELDGRESAAVAFSEQVSLVIGRPRPDDRSLLFSVASYRESQKIMRADAATGAQELVRASAARHDLKDCVVRQVFVTAKDGTHIPMTLIHTRRPRARRQRADAALRLWRLRDLHAARAVLRHRAVGAPRRRLCDRLDPRRRRVRPRLARRGARDQEADQLRRLHRLRRMAGGASA
jgi:prolyl oligopeptidase